MRTILLLLLASTLSFSAGAQQKSPRDLASDLVATLSKGAFKVESTFEAPGGLLGLMVTGKGGRHLMFATPDGRYLLRGGLRDGADQDPLIPFHQKLQEMKPDRSAATPPASAISGDGSIPVPNELAGRLLDFVGPKLSGSGEARMIVFADPLCPYCRKAYTALKSPEARSKYAIQWVLTSAVGGEKSDALIHRVKKGEMTLDQLETVDPARIAVIPVPDQHHDEQSAMLDLLDQAFGRPASVPAFLYPTITGWRIKTGFVPEEWGLR